MIAYSNGLILSLLVLTIFVLIGLRSAGAGKLTRDNYLSARNTQSWLPISFSLLASGMGAWILFGPSEVGYYGGFFDIFAYALSAFTPFLVLIYAAPYIRQKLPKGITLADFIRKRAGRSMQVFVGIIGLLYMFTFIVAELSAIGLAGLILADIEPIILISWVAIATSLYTSLGGLPASIRTDRAQGVAILVLLSLVIVIFLGSEPGKTIELALARNPEDEFSIGSLSHFSLGGLKSGLALLIAVTAAELFSQGYWQRARAAVSGQVFKKAGLTAGLISFVIVFAMGAIGAVAAGEGSLGIPSTALFSLVDHLPSLFVILLLVLALALVTSSVDTLQNAITTSFIQDIRDGKGSIEVMKFVTILVMLPAIWIALQVNSVFGVFLVADLMATATIVPVLLTIWQKVTQRAAIVGTISGFLSVVAYGAWQEDIAKGLGYLIKPTDGFGLASLGVFLAALLGSTVVTLGITLAGQVTKPSSKKA